MTAITRTVLRLALAGALALPPGWALAYRQAFQNEVVPISDSRWEVVSRGSSSARAFWCTAGDYALGRLGVSGTQRIYLWRAVGSASGSATRDSAQFSLAAPQGANTRPGVFLSVRHAGDNMTAAMAREFCFDDHINDP